MQTNSAQVQTVENVSNPHPSLQHQTVLVG